MRSLMSRLDDLSRYPHAQRERLAFIDFCLYYFGEVSKADLLRQFAALHQDLEGLIGVLRAMARQRGIPDWRATAPSEWHGSPVTRPDSATGLNAELGKGSYHSLLMGY